MQVVLFTECNGSPGWGRDAGCYTVASQLRKNGFSVQVLDFFSFFNNELWQKTIDQFFDSETIVMGFSSTHFSSFLPEDFDDWMTDAKRTEKNNAWNTYFPFSAQKMSEIFLEIKKRFPRIKVIVGGQKVVQKRKLQSIYPEVDHWVEGMADLSIIEICKDLSHESTKVKKRISSEDQYGPYNDFTNSSLLWSENDFIFKDEALPLEISRGCPFDCSFCDYKKKSKGQLIKKKEVLVKELIDNYEKFGTNHYMITDFLVNEDIDKIKMVHNVFTSLPFKIEWSGFARLDLLLKWPEMIDLILESGARSVMWGIEGIRKDLGPTVGKVCDLKKLEPLLQDCRKAWGDHIVTGSGFIVGLPGETQDSANELLDWILDSKPLLHGFEVTPLFIGLYNEEKATRIDYSKIQKNPKSFGYELVIEQKNNSYQEDWIFTSTGFKKSDAIKTIEKYQSDPRWKERRLIGTYHNYSRFRNLGLTHDEILNSVSSNLDFISKVKGNYYEKSKKYFNNIFS